MTSGPQGESQGGPQSESQRGPRGDSQHEPFAPSGVASVPAPGLARLQELASALELELPCEHFFFLRHGQTLRNQQRIFQTPEEPLSARGIGQAQVAAALLAEQRLAGIVCSDLPRAVMTARIVAKAQAGASELKPREQASLRERNFGDLIGTSTLDLDWACSPNNGELLEQFIERTRRGLKTALADPAAVLIVAHGGTLHVLAAMLGVAADTPMLGNGLALRFSREGGRWTAAPLGEPGDRQAANRS